MLCLIDFTHSDGKEKMYAIGIPQLHVKKKKRKKKRGALHPGLILITTKRFQLYFFINTPQQQKINKTTS